MLEILKYVTSDFFIFCGCTIFVVSSLSALGVVIGSVVSSTRSSNK